MQTDPLADFLTQIRNANLATIQEVRSPYSKMKSRVAAILKEEGYIEDFSLETVEGKPQLRVKLRFTEGRRAIRGLERVSKPGRRHFVSADQIPQVLGGLGTAVLSTSSGVMSGREAKKKNVGGEVLLFVW